MSDAAENVEIEDVLASIRRLVSDEVTRELKDRDVVQTLRDDTGGTSETDSEALTDSDEQAAGDALVLSASFRVADAPETAPEPEGQTAKTETEDENHDKSGVAADGELSAEAEQAEADASDVDVDTSDNVSVIHDQVLSAVADQIANLDAPAEAEQDAVDPDPEIDAGDEFVFDLSERAFEESTDEDTGAETDVAPLNLAEVGAQIFPGASGADEATAKEDVSDNTETAQDGLESKIARLERLIGTQDNGWEPESEDAPQPEVAAPLADAIEWQDADAEAADAPDEAETDVEAPASAIGQSEPESEAVLDEDMLRGMVAAIVREELQGALGERITRNVRKLVRREIHRALASHELD